MNRSFPLVVLFGVILGVALGLMLTPFLATEGQVTLAVWMEVVHQVCTSIGGLGTFVALIFVVRQFNLLHHESDLVQRNTKAVMDAQIYARLDSFNKFIVNHDKEYELLDQPYEPNKHSDQKYRLHHLCDLGFTFFEEIFKHYKRYGLMETEDWDEWQQNMAHFFSKRYVRGYWPTIANRFAGSFQAFANELVARMEIK